MSTYTDPQRVSRSATLLRNARITGVALTEMPPQACPLSLSEAYAVQDLTTALFGWTRVGWKAGLPSKAVRENWNLDVCLAGQLHSHTVVPGTMQLWSLGHAALFEAEYTFRIGREVPLRELPYRAEEMVAYVDAVIPSIEIVYSRFCVGAAPNLYASLADNSSHGCLLIGEAVHDWQELDLVNGRVALEVGTREVGVGSGASVLGNPLEVLAWFASQRPPNAFPLRVGDLIATGGCVKEMLDPDTQVVTARFEGLGAVEARFTKPANAHQHGKVWSPDLGTGHTLPPAGP